MSRVDSVGIAAQSGAGPNKMGTKKTVMDYFVPVESAAPAPSMEVMDADETIGSRFPTDKEIGGVFFEPEFAGKVRATNLPRLLSGWMGDPVSALKSAGVYNHTFDPTLVTAIPRAQSILITRSDPTPPIVDLFWDALGNDLNLTVETNDWLSFEAKYVARSLDSAQPAPTVIQDLTRKFPFYTMTAFMTIPTVLAGVETATAISAFGAQWTGNISTDALQLGSRDLYSIVPGNVDLEVTFTVLQDIKDHYRRAFLTTPDPIKLRLLAQGPVIAGADKYEVELILHRCIVTEVSADVDAGETLMGAEVTCQASLNPSDGKFYTARVQNAIATYP